MRIKTITITTFFACAAAFSDCEAQSLTAINDIIDCGQVEYMQPVSAEFELRNTSNRSVRIRRVETYCGCVVAEFTRKQISTKDKATVKITYDAMQMGHFDKVIEVYCGNEDQPLTLRMKGVVVREATDYAGNFPYKMGVLMTDRNTLEFDDVNSGDQPQLLMHVRNVGSEVVQPTIMHLPDYLNADVSPSTLPPGRTGTITVTLDSRLVDDLGLTQTRVYLGSRPGEKVSAEKEITVSVVVIPQFDDMTEAELRDAPRIELSTQKLLFDPANNSRKQRQEILITNTGQSELHISNLQMFTEGLMLSLNKQTISPGDVAKLKVGIDTDMLKNVQSEPRILMITNDPDNPKVVVRISFDNADKVQTP